VDLFLQNGIFITIDCIYIHMANQNTLQNPHKTGHSVTYFISDTTRPNKDGTPYIATGFSVQKLIKYLEGICLRKFSMNRSQLISDSSHLIGYEENTDRTFYDLMRPHFQMGIIRDYGLIHQKMIECDILRESYYSSRESEHGN